MTKSEKTPAEKWHDEIRAAEQELRKFHERGKGANKRFLDERDNLNALNKWFNIYYANTNILESALYAQLPKPAVSRRFTDHNDDVGRVASLIIERAITQDLDDPTDMFDSTMRHAVQDRLVPGLAAAWLRLETTTEPLETSTSLPPTSEGGDAPDQPLQRISSQRVVVDYVYWQDFLWSPCRVWEERRWTGRKVYMTREALIKRFGEKIGKVVPLNFKAGKTDVEPGSTPQDDITQKAVIYEIWDRETREAVWVSKGFDQLLDKKADPLQLTSFEPCPKPMLANISTSNTTPRPDYYMIQDQFNELDTINNRISMLVQACKVVGVYDKSAVGIARMLNEGFDNQLIPVDNWAMFAEKGGVKGAIDWLPLEAISQALSQLNQARDVIKGQIYELTGIADIVRGASKASETLGAQQIKAQFASVRIKKLQDEVARFASDIMRIKAEIMVKHFDPALLVQKSNIEVTGNDEYIAPALELLKSEQGFEWKIQVNSDTMSQADYAMEKSDRIEFLTSVSKFMAEVGPMIQAAPESAPIMLGMLKWTVAAFRGARDIEGMLDKVLDQLEQQAKQPPEPKGPTPEEQKLELEKQRMQMQQEAQQQKAMLDQQVATMKAQIEQQAAQQALMIEQQRAQMEFAAEQQRQAAEKQRQELALMFEQLMGQLKVKNLKEMHDAKLEAIEEQAEAKSRASEANTDE